MSVVGEWRRRAVGAAGAGMLAPGAVVLAAVAVGLGGGGVSGLNALGQAVTGPVIPDVRRAPDRERSQRDQDLIRRVPSSRRPSSSAGSGSGGSGSGSPAGGSDSGSGSGSRPGSGPGPGSGSGSNGPHGSGSGGRARPDSGSGNSGGGSGGGSTTSPDPVATATPAPTPASPLRQLGDTLNGVIRPLPVVGPTTAEVVDGLIDAVDQLPPKK